eukprot:7748876-Pyramimonas_sp.AAC.1
MQSEEDCSWRLLRAAKRAARHLVRVQFAQCRGRLRTTNPLPSAEAVVGAWIAPAARARADPMPNADGICARCERTL